MSGMSMTLVLAVLFLAYSNGANDTFKGVATLFGSGTSDYRKALLWAVGTTLVGALLGLTLAHGLVQTFQGKGLVPEAVTMQPAFLLAVSVGAAMTVMAATRLGLPVATTHALLGALAGGGWMAAGEVDLQALTGSFVLPLLLSPVAALVATGLLYRVVRRLRRWCGIANPERAKPDLMTDGLHYLSGGAVSFARGLNSTPKMVALLLSTETLDPHLGLVLVTAVMSLGGLLNSRPVAETLSRKITPMDAEQGLTANLVTALLVLTAGWKGLPVSTTHVAVGAIFGIGVVTGSANARSAVAILLAWVTTVPLGALLAAGSYAILRFLGLS